jgi:hypothetical protein
LWSGCCKEGWAGEGKPIEKNGIEKTRRFGEYLGKRYTKFTNLFWIMGGDNDPHEDQEAIRQLALGIKQMAPQHLLTYHAASTHSSTDIWGQDEPWLDVVMVYTYFRGFNKAWNKNQLDVYEVANREYNKKPVKPFFLGESTYEGEHDSWGSALQARKQAYWAILSGGTGHAYGSPLWRLDSTWRKHLDLPGAKSMKHLYTLFTSHAWEKLVPDTANLVAVDGRGTYGTNDYATTAIAADGSYAISYLPSRRSISINLTRLKGSRLKAYWYDPRTGGNKIIGNFTAKKVITLTSPTDEDWVLLIEQAN